MPITIEFTAKSGDKSFKEDSVTFANPEEMLRIYFAGWWL